MSAPTILLKKKKKKILKSRLLNCVSVFWKKKYFFRESNLREKEGEKLRATSFYFLYGSLIN